MEDGVQVTRSEFDKLRTRVEVLERQMKIERQQLRDALFWLDVHCSWLWKRLWWAACGFRFYRLGQWRGSSGKNRFPWFD